MRPLIIGWTFGRLGVIQRQGSVHKRSTWLCVCRCGKERVVLGDSLWHGVTRSCGCLRSEKCAARMRQMQIRAGENAKRRKIMDAMFADEEPVRVIEPPKQWLDLEPALVDLQCALGYRLPAVLPAARAVRYLDLAA